MTKQINTEVNSDKSDFVLTVNKLYGILAKIDDSGSANEKHIDILNAKLKDLRDYFTNNI